MANDSTRLRELRDLLEVVASAHELPETLDRIARWVETTSPGVFCSILLLDDEGTRLLHGAAPSLPADFVRQVHGMAIGPGRGSCGTAAYLARPVIVADIATDPLWEGARHVVLAHGLRACWSHPLLSSAGTVLGTFAIYRREVSTPSDAQWQMVVDAARLGALAIERARAAGAHEAHVGGIASILEHAMDVILRVDTAGRYTYANPVVLEVTGKRIEDMVGRTPEELGFPPELCRHFRDVNAITARTRLPFRHEYAFPTPGGECWFDSVTAPEFDAFGRLTAYVVIARDMTARRRAEQALRTSEERLRLVFSHTGRSMALLDVNGCFVELGEFGLQAVGLVREELLGRPYWEMPNFHDSPETRETLRGAIGEAAAGRQVSGDVAFRGADGSRRQGWFTVTPIRDAAGDVAQLLMEGGDNTEQRELEQRVRQSDKMESLGRLAGGIAHDFNNILAAILGYAELVAADTDPRTETADNVQRILDASRRARDLVRQILTFSRKSDFRHAPIELGEVVAGAMSLLRSSIPSTIRLEEHLAGEPTVVRGDASQLSQVLLNLGANAEYAMRGNAHGRLTVSLERVTACEEHALIGVSSGSPCARLVVRDSGSGIAPDVLPKVFEPFFTTKPVGEGTGMGLAVVHGIVTAHGGSVRVTSDRNGTTFEVFLPCVDASTPSGRSRASGTVPALSGRILVVDDEEAVVRVLERALPRHGFAVRCCTSSVEALALFLADPNAFDAVVSDRTMPRLRGEELADRIQAIRPSMPVILCTGQATTSDEPVAGRRRLHLAKPFDIADLVAALAAVLPVPIEASS